MNIQSFENMIAWQKARILTNSIYSIFKDQKDFSFKNQIERASVSIMNNLAEGFERQSDKELRQFLYIAKGSCAEVRSMLYLAYDLKYISDQDFKNLSESTLEISRILHGFIKKL